MPYASKEIKDAAFELMASIGNPATRTNKGQQCLVQLADGTKANLKTAGKGGLMVKTRGMENDSEIIGFNADVSHILAAVRLPKEDFVTAYLIPLDMAEKAYRRNNREWCALQSGRATDTWVLRFYNRNQKTYGDNMAAEWKKYSVGTISLSKSLESSSPKAILEQSRKNIAAAYGVEPKQVRIQVDL